jgi:hypothetical protein
VCEYITLNTYVRIGPELRHMLVGTPMGEPGQCLCTLATCAQANAVCQDAEQIAHIQRESACGDSERIANLGFVDDMLYKFAYDRADRGWTRQQANELLEAATSMFPAPLSLE